MQVFLAVFFVVISALATPAVAGAEEAFLGRFHRALKYDPPSPMPEVRFSDLSGTQTLSWGDFHGRYLLVNFWATWCPPCIDELPSLEKLKDFRPDKLAVIAISVDRVEDPQVLADFLDRRDIGDFAALYDKTGLIRRRMLGQGLPTSYLLDRQGRRMYMFLGDASWTSRKARAFFTKVFDENE